MMDEEIKDKEETTETTDGAYVDGVDMKALEEYVDGLDEKSQKALCDMLMDKFGYEHKDEVDDHDEDNDDKSTSSSFKKKSSIKNFDTDGMPE